MKPIVTTPNDVLVKPAKLVERIDGRVRKIIAEMKTTLLEADNPKGVGLAAPQIGIPLQIFILRPQASDSIRVCINPTIIDRSQKLLKGIPGDKGEGKLEGCLSIPKIWGVVTRHATVKLKYLDETGQAVIRDFSGFPAIIVQHEVDHLSGILFTKRVIEQKGRLYKAGENEKGEEILEPLEL